MKAIDSHLDDKKNIVSIRLNNSDRDAMRVTAARLLVRESELYRFAIHHFLSRLQGLQDNSYTGSDLLPLFLEFRDELNSELGLKKHQLFEILNGRTADPSKFVSMSDVELLLLPQHSVRQRLHQLPEAVDCRRADSSDWLEQYFRVKYGLAKQLPNQPDDLAIDC